MNEICDRFWHGGLVAIHVRASALAITMSDSSNSEMETTASTVSKPIVEDCGLSILQRAALATCDLAQPVRLTHSEGSGYVFDTSKGENLPDDITRQSADEITQFYEDLLGIIDKGYCEAEDDGLSADTITEAEWFGPYKHYDYFYCFEDLSYQLDPNRSKTLLDPILSALGEGPDGFPLASDRITLLRKELDRECQEGDSCTYRIHFPEVGQSGPVALSPVLLTLLSEACAMAAVNNISLEYLLDAVLSILVPAEGEDDGDDVHFDDEHAYDSDKVASNLSSALSSNIPVRCFCCLWTKQSRSYVDSKTEVGRELNEESLLSWTTWLGVLKTKMVKEGHRVNKTDFLSPVVNIHDGMRCYMADSTPFDEYRLLEQTVEDGQGCISDTFWVVKRSVTESEEELQKVRSIEERIEMAGRMDGV